LLSLPDELARLEPVACSMTASVSVFGVSRWTMTISRMDLAEIKLDTNTPFPCTCHNPLGGLRSFSQSLCLGDSVKDSAGDIAAISSLDWIGHRVGSGAGSRISIDIREELRLELVEPLNNPEIPPAVIRRKKDSVRLTG